MPLLRRFESLAVGKKLAVSFASLLLLLITVSIFSFVALEDYNHRVLILERANAAEIALLEAERDEKNFRITKDRGYIDHAIGLVDEATSALSPLMEMIHEESERAIVAEVLNDIGVYRELLRRYEANISTQPDIVASIEEQLLATATHAIDLTERLKEREQVVMAKRYDLTKIEIVIVTVVAIVVSLLVAWSLTKSITSPILESVKIANRVADGDLTVDIKSQRGDEFGQLLSAFSTMVTNLRELVREIDAGASGIASSSEELSTVTEQTSRGVAEQQSQTDKVATAMNEMVATVNDVAKSAESAFYAANQASEKSGSGEKAVRETLEFVAELNKQSANVTELLKDLQSETNNIGAVLDVIKSVAEQTNLLALNAAIEAARAGEHGRGFAVVADEVRSLAKRTQSSTTEIETLVTNLVSSAEASVAGMETGNNLAQQTLDRAESAGTAIREMAESVEEIREYNSQIATAAEQQSTVAEDINQSITGIRDVGDQSATSAEQVSAASAELARLAEGLSVQISRFKV